MQELDHVSIMKPITKFAATVPHTQRIPEIISMAFREAYNGRPGPSFLEIPQWHDESDHVQIMLMCRSQPWPG